MQSIKDDSYPQVNKPTSTQSEIEDLDLDPNFSNFQTYTHFIMPCSSSGIKKKKNENSQRRSEKNFCFTYKRGIANQEIKISFFQKWF